jgi:hypothetical protein
MAHVEDFIRVLEAHRGRPYHAASAARFGPRVFDCSGYMVFGLRAVGIANPPTVSSTQARWSYTAGLEMPVAAGVRTRGAFLFMGPDRGLRGFGPDGHVALALGDGRTIETPAPGRVSGFGRVSGRAWSGAGRVPGLDYGPRPTRPPDTGAHQFAPRLAGMYVVNEEGGSDRWFEVFEHAMNPIRPEDAIALITSGTPSRGEVPTLVLVQMLQQRGVVFP